MGAGIGNLHIFLLPLFYEVMKVLQPYTLDAICYVTFAIGGNLVTSQDLRIGLMVKV